MALLRLQSVGFRYPSGFQLRDVDLSLGDGSFMALLGPNGSGKSTLIKLISRLASPDSGVIELQGKPLDSLRPRDLARTMAVIPSENYFEFPFRAGDVAAMGRFPYLGRLQRMSQGDRRVVRQAMEMTETEKLAERPISELSSGERQRVLIARALAQQPRLLVLDEPNAHLDIKHQIAVFRLLRRLNRDEKLTILVVLHDLTMASVFCGEIVLMNRGEVAKQGPPEEVITSETVRSVYGADVAVQALRGGGRFVVFTAEAGEPTPGETSAP